MTQTKQTLFAQTYAESFKEAYPALPVEKSEQLIEKALLVALKDIGAVNIDGAAFRATCKKLEIKHSYKAIQEYLGGNNV